MSLGCQNLSLTVAEKSICQQFSWQGKSGDCWAVLGQNGVGKTTLLHALAGLAQPESGEIHLNNQPLSKLSHAQRAQQLGVLLQEPDYAFPSTVLETVLVGRHPHLSRWQVESRQDVEIAQQALEQVGLTGFAERNVQTLSGGERRRVQFAQLLAQQTHIMLLDEPVNHLDIAHQLSLLQLVRDKVGGQNGLVVMVLHDVNLALRFCDQAILMFGDEIVQGAVTEVINEASLQRLYGCAMERSGKWFFPL